MTTTASTSATARERLDMTLGDAIYSLRAIRRHRREPIPDDDITAILDAAIQAPNGANTVKGLAAANSIIPSV